MMRGSRLAQRVKNGLRRNGVCPGCSRSLSGHTHRDDRGRKWHVRCYEVAHRQPFRDRIERK